MVFFVVWLRERRAEPETKCLYLSLLTLLVVFTYYMYVEIAGAESPRPVVFLEPVTPEAGRRAFKKEHLVDTVQADGRFARGLHFKLPRHEIAAEYYRWRHVMENGTVDVMSLNSYKNRGANT